METKSLREIDLLIAERVMGWPVLRRSDYGDGGFYAAAEKLADEHGAKYVVTVSADGYWHLWEPRASNGFYNRMPPTDFTTDIAAAWQVVERMKDEWRVKLVAGPMCPFVTHLEPVDDPTRNWVGAAATAPLAICLAALRAHGIDVSPTPGANT